jgi:hypothetical protein
MWSCGRKRAPRVTTGTHIAHHQVAQFSIHAGTGKFLPRKNSGLNSFA